MTNFFFRDSQFKSSVFLFYSTIFLNHFFNALLMRLICWSRWPPWTCCITQTCFPHFLLKVLYPLFNCAYINTFIPLHCLHVAMNVSGRNFFPNEELDNSTLFESNILTAFHFDWHWIGVMVSCGYSVTYGGGEMSCDSMVLVLSSFLYTIKKMWQRRQSFQPVPNISKVSDIVDVCV